MQLGEGDVAWWQSQEQFFFLIRGGPDDFSGDAHDDHAVWDFQAWGHDGAGGDEAGFADFRSA